MIKIKKELKIEAPEESAIVREPTEEEEALQRLIDAQNEDLKTAAIVLNRHDLVREFMAERRGES